VIIAYNSLKNIKIEIAVFQMIYLCIFNFTTITTADEIVLSADEWCPYNCNPLDENRGFLMDVAEFSLARKGHTIKYVQVPWQRAIRQVMANQYQGLVGPAKADAPELIYPKNHLHVVHNIFYVLNESDWKYTGIKSLESLNLGVTSNYYYGDAINAYIEINKNNKSRVTIISDDTAVNRLTSLLKRNRIDAFIGVRGVVQHYHDNQIESLSIKEAGEGLSQEVYIGFSPNNPNSQAYADALDEGMTKLRKTGELQQLYKKYKIEKKSK
jgi:polar amino acid transport system substrate-binding protein